MSLFDNVFKSWKSTLVGIAIMGAGFYFFKIDEIEFWQMLVLISGLLLLFFNENLLLTLLNKFNIPFLKRDSIETRQEPNEQINK